jgi:hypothetical protein
LVMRVEHHPEPRRSTRVGRSRTSFAEGTLNRTANGRLERRCIDTRKFRYRLVCATSEHTQSQYCRQTSPHVMVDCITRPRAKPQVRLQLSACRATTHIVYKI